MGSLDYSKNLAHHENEIGLRIIECLREAEKRMLYMQMGMSSLWDFATRFLGLSHGNAHLKISAMRLARDLRDRIIDSCAKITIFAMPKFRLAQS